jgi:hypothetical protein
MTAGYTAMYERNVRHKTKLEMLSEIPRQSLPAIARILGLKSLILYFLRFLNRKKVYKKETRTIHSPQLAQEIIQDLKKYHFR